MHFFRVSNHFRATRSGKVKIFENTIFTEYVFENIRLDNKSLPQEWGAGHVRHLGANDNRNINSTGGSSKNDICHGERTLARLTA